jgi:hypothetical protein
MTDDASSLGIVPDGLGAVPDGTELPGMELTGADATGPPASATDGQPAPEPAYAAVEDWVIDYFLPMFRRTLGGEFRWCAQWWRHGEAISRLRSLWHSWEVLRLRPGTGIATWYRDYLDHQLPILMGARGPFYQCSETAHREPRETIAVPAPADWWDTGEDEAASAPGDAPATEADDGSATGAADDGDLLALPGDDLPGQDDRAGDGEDRG